MPIIKRDQLPWSEIAHELVGAEHGLGITLLFVDAERGRGPALHRHPLCRGDHRPRGREVDLTLDGERHVARAGDIVVVLPNQAHSFVNSGSGPLRQIDIHLSPSFSTEWLEDRDTGARRWLRRGRSPQSDQPPRTPTSPLLPPGDISALARLRGSVSTPRNDRYHFHGYVTAVEDVSGLGYPLRAHTRLELGDARRTHRGSIGARRARIRLDRTQPAVASRWQTDGPAHRVFRRRSRASACTNALPVNRLKLEVGQTADAPAVYVRARDLQVERLEQRYERLPNAGERERYEYIAPSFDFRPFSSTNNTASCSTIQASLSEPRRRRSALRTFLNGQGLAASESGPPCARARAGRPPDAGSVLAAELWLASELGRCESVAQRRSRCRIMAPIGDPSAVLSRLRIHWRGSSWAPISARLPADAVGRVSGSGPGPSRS